jgi:uncharacterized protein
MIAARAASRGLLFALLLLGAVPLLALVEVPALTARVTDLTGTLSAGDQAALEQELAAFESRKGAQLAVLMVPTTQPETIEQYGLRVAEQWQLGRADVDDGALLLVAKDDRALRIEVGYGLEGALNDATANRIIDEVIAPRFRAGDFAGGVRAGVARMMAVIDGEPLPPPTAARRGPGGLDDILPLLPVLLIFTVTFGATLKRALGQLPGSLVTGGLAALVVWWLVSLAAVATVAGIVAFLLTLMSRAGPGRWVSRGPGWGGGFGGGGGGGGFRGGGGGFGGGGASGRW